jgi:hypothetical protein
VVMVGLPCTYVLAYVSVSGASSLSGRQPVRPAALKAQAMATLPDA